MAYSNDDRLGIPDFMQKTSTYGSRSSVSSRERGYARTRNTDEDVFINMARKNSLDSRRVRNTGRTKKCDKSFVGILKRNWKGLVVTMGLGAALFSGVQAFGDKIHEMDMIGSNATYSSTVEAVNFNKNIILNGEFVDGNPPWWLDTAATSQRVDTILENGGDPLIVLGALSDSLSEDYSQDELRSVVKHSYGEDPDTLVRNLNPERYEEGIQDPDFKADVRNYTIQQTEADIVRSNIETNVQLEAMLNSSESTQNTGMKGIGGK